MYIATAAAYTTNETHSQDDSVVHVQVVIPSIYTVMIINMPCPAVHCIGYL